MRFSVTLHVLFHVRHFCLDWPLQLLPSGVKIFLCNCVWWLACNIKEVLDNTPPSPLRTGAFPSSGKSSLSFSPTRRFRYRVTYVMCYGICFLCTVKCSCMAEFLSHCIMRKVNAWTKKVKCQCSLFFVFWQLDWFRQLFSLLFISGGMFLWHQIVFRALPALNLWAVLPVFDVSYRIPLKVFLPQRRTYVQWFLLIMWLAHEVHRVTILLDLNDGSEKRNEWLFISRPHLYSYTITRQAVYF